MVKKNLPAMQEIQVQSLGREDLLEKKMATHSTILAWRIPWSEESGGLQSMGLQRVGHDWLTNTSLSTILKYTVQLWLVGIGGSCGRQRRGMTALTHPTLPGQLTRPFWSSLITEIKYLTTTAFERLSFGNNERTRWRPSNEEAPCGSVQRTPHTHTWK